MLYVLYDAINIMKKLKNFSQFITEDVSNIDLDESLIGKSPKDFIKIVSNFLDKLNLKYRTYNRAEYGINKIVHYIEIKGENNDHMEFFTHEGNYCPAMSYYHYENDDDVSTRWVNPSKMVDLKDLIDFLSKHWSSILNRDVFKQINEEQEELSKGEMLQFQLRDFNTKKNNLKKLVLSNVDTEKDIEKNYLDIVQENPFLQHYGNILKIEAEILRKENKLKETDETITRYEEDMDLVGKLSDDSEKEKQTSTLQELVDGKLKETSDDEQSIKDLKSQHIDLQKNLQQMINQKGQELQEIERGAVYEDLYIDHKDIENDVIKKGYTIEDINGIKDKCKEANMIYSYLSNEERENILSKFNIKKKINLDLSALPFKKIESVCDYVINLKFNE